MFNVSKMSGVRDRVLLVGVLFMFCIIHQVSMSDFEMPKYSLSSLCGGHINLKWKNIYTAELSLSPGNLSARSKDGASWPPYKHFQSCDVTVESWDFLNKLIVRFEEFRLHSGCEDTSLEMLDGIEDVKNITDLPRPICGHHREVLMSRSFVTTDKYLTIRLHGNKILDEAMNIKLYITAFHDGTCRSYEYPCANGRCIMEDLSCNGYNPCGDNSDCPIEAPPDVEAPQEVEVDSHPVFLAVIIAISVAAVLVIIGVVAIIRCYRLRRKRRRRECSPTSDLEYRNTRPIRSERSAANYLRTESQIEAERRFAPPSYNSLPVFSEQEPEEDNNSSAETEDIEDDSCNEVTFYSRNSPNPPAYNCVMKNQDMFRVSQTDIYIEAAKEESESEDKT